MVDSALHRSWQPGSKACLHDGMPQPPPHLTTQNLSPQHPTPCSPPLSTKRPRRRVRQAVYGSRESIQTHGCVDEALCLWESGRKELEK
ncbi:hypothetical protein BC567DRAFT_227902 [Phyllosticta citribraziliensis]